jgi:nucleolin
MSKKNTKNVQVSDESSEEVVQKKKAPQKRKQSSDSESDQPKKTVPAKKSAKKDSDEESSEVVTKKPQHTKKTEDDGETHSELFVKNLSWQSTEDSVYEYFAKFGTVTTVKLLTDKMTGKPKGIGFVAFENRADAKKALENIGDIDGRTPTCSWSNDKSGIGAPRTGGDRPSNSGGQSGDNHTIFVGNLGFNTNEQSIKKFFSRAGNIVGVRIAKHEDGKAKGFCHVDFDSSDAVQTAITYAGQDLDGREVRVDASQPRQNRDSGFGGGRGGGRGGFGGGRGRGGFGGGRGRY